MRLVIIAISVGAIVYVGVPLIHVPVDALIASVCAIVGALLGEVMQGRVAR
jgi:hypothetical protein